MNVPTSRQLSGSEYNGVQPTYATVQPKPEDALNNGERLRLGYLTGHEDYPESFEDRRQMLGLKPAAEGRPNWITHTRGRQLSEGEIVERVEEQLEADQ